MFEQSPSSLLKPEVIVEMVLRRRWWIIIPVMISLTIGIVLAIKLPKEYSASTSILVEPQSVPKEFVKSIVTEGIGSRIKTISQQILSRTNLENVIKEFKLVEEGENDSTAMEGNVNSLRSQIAISVRNSGKAANHFSISFTSENPELSKRYCQPTCRHFHRRKCPGQRRQIIRDQQFLGRRVKRNEEAARRKRACPS